MSTEIEVEVVSKQQIKPSSPTPHHLRRVQLSFLDEIKPRISMPIIHFYSQNPTTSNLQVSDNLKKSLSDALTVFYPLAGRVKNNSYVDCNDEGVLYVEARANCSISSFFENKYSSNFQNYKFLPLQPDECGDLGASVQVTFFSCGGYAIALSLSHKLGDGSSHFMFLKSWAAVARGNKVAIPPFGTAALFPPKNLPEVFPVFKEKIATRVFVFEATTISNIRARYAFNGEKLSRVQALAAFIWSRLVATGQTQDVNTKYMMSLAVNLRQKTVPPLPVNSFGNLLWVTSAIADKDDVEKGIYGYTTAKKMKEAIKDVNVDFVEKLQKSDDPFKSFKERRNELVTGQIKGYTFTSLCNFPAYDADFGWGKPEWVASGGLFFKNLVMFFDSKEGERIEAWISLEEDEMAKFEADDELLSHVSSSSRNGKFRKSKTDAQSRL